MSMTLDLPMCEEMQAVLEDNGRLEKELHVAQNEVERLLCNIAFLQENEAVLNEDIDKAAKQINSLAAVNEALREENNALKSNSNEHKEIANQAKVYASLLEKMLSCADDATTAAQEANNTAEMETWAETKKHLEEENQQLHNMMAEFSSVWNSDSRKFHETMEAVSAQRDKAVEELRKFKQQYLDDQKMFEETQRQNAQLVENQTWLNRQTAELQSALDKLIANRERTTEQLVEMTSKWNESREELESVIGKLRSELEEEKAMHNYAEEDFLAEIQELKEFLEKEKLNKQDTEERLMKLKNESETGATALKDAEVQMLVNKIKSLEKLLDDEHEKLNQDVNAQFENMNSQLEDLQEAYDCAEKMSELEIEELKMRIESDRKTFEKDLQKSAKSIDNLISQLKQSADQIEVLQTSSQNSEQLLAESKKVIRNMQEELCSLRRECIMIDEQKQANKKEADALREQIEALQDKFAREKEELQEKYASEEMRVRNWYHEETSENASKYLRQLSALQEEFDRNIEKNGVVKRGLENQISELTAGWEKLTTELKEERVRRCGMTELASSLRKELEQLKTSHAKEMEQLADAHKRLIGNLGVEEIDDQDQQEADVPSSSSGCEWELVDKE